MIEDYYAPLQRSALGYWLSMAMTATPIATTVTMGDQGIRFPRGLRAVQPNSMPVLLVFGGNGHFWAVLVKVLLLDDHDFALLSFAVGSFNESFGGRPC
jgi:hypothetical protein